MPTDPTLRAIRESYDRVADEYARRIADELDHKPFDREFLRRFASGVREDGVICDLGCGPGHVGRYLAEGGALAVCADSSRGMLEQARAHYPGLPLVQTDMTALSLAGDSLGGVVAFYAIVNLGADVRRLAFREMARVLEPGGLLALAFHAGTAVLHEDELWGRPISMDFFFLDPDLVARELEEAGLEVLEALERAPYPEVEYPSRRAYIVARKAAPTPGSLARGLPR